MKKTAISMLTGIIALLIMALPASAADELAVDPVHSSIVFNILHMNAAPVFGRFNEMSGTINLDTASPANSSVSFTVQTASIDTANSKRNDHLVSPDFFSAKEFPTMTFKSTSVSKVDDSTWKVKGNLTAHGVTKEVTFNATHRLGQGANGAAIHGFYTEFSINRMDFNIGPSFDNNALSHEVKLYISLEAK